MALYSKILISNIPRMSNVQRSTSLTNVRLVNIRRANIHCITSFKLGMIHIFHYVNKVPVGKVLSTKLVILSSMLGITVSFWILFDDSS